MGNDKRRWRYNKITAIAVLLSLYTAFNMGNAQAVGTADETASASKITRELQMMGGAVFPIGSPNLANKDNFQGDSFVARLSESGVPIFNVTFWHGAHTNWHIHHKTCQILVAESGSGYYQIWGQEPKKLMPGETVTIPAGIKHWHGAAPGKSFQHLAIMQAVSNASTEWMEPVDDAMYQALQ